jgi:hypothetical protein
MSLLKDCTCYAIVELKKYSKYLKKKIWGNKGLFWISKTEIGECIVLAYKEKLMNSHKLCKCVRRALRNCLKFGKITYENSYTRAVFDLLRVPRIKQKNSKVAISEKSITAPFGNRIIGFEEY